MSDRYRYNWALLDKYYNARAAYAISNEGTDWSKWTMYRNGGYQQYAGQDYEIKTGHQRAGMWNV